MSIFIKLSKERLTNARLFFDRPNTEPQNADHPTPNLLPDLEISRPPNADKDCEYPSPQNFYSAFGLAIMLLGIILFTAPTSGKISRLISFVQCLLGAILVAVSL